MNRVVHEHIRNVMPPSPESSIEIPGHSANVESVVFLRRILTTRLASFGVLAALAVMNEGISATMGLVPIER